MSISFDKQEYYGEDVNLITQRHIIKQWSNVIEFEEKLRSNESKITIFDYGNYTFITENSNQVFTLQKKEECA